MTRAWLPFYNLNDSQARFFYKNYPLIMNGLSDFTAAGIPGIT